MARKKKDADAQVAAAADQTGVDTDVAVATTGEPAAGGAGEEPADEKQPAAYEAGDEGRTADAGAADTAPDAAGAGDDETAEEEHSHLVGEEPPEYWQNVRARKARRAACLAYLGVLGAIGSMQPPTGNIQSPVTCDPDYDPFREAGTFLLANTDAPAASIPVHLALKKLGGSMTPDATETMLWGVFADVFGRVHTYLASIDALKFVIETEAAGGMGGEQAFKLEPGAFDADALKPL